MPRTAVSAMPPQVADGRISEGKLTLTRTEQSFDDRQRLAIKRLGGRDNQGDAKDNDAHDNSSSAVVSTTSTSYKS